MRSFTFVCIFFVIVYTGCTTTVPVTVTRPAELDIAGARTVAVLPFQTGQPLSGTDTNISSVNIIINMMSRFHTDNRNESVIADYLTAGLTRSVSNSSYLQLIDSTAVMNAMTAGRDSPADIYITGYTTAYWESVDMTVVDEEKKLAEYVLNISATVAYQIVDARSYQVLAYRTKDIEEASMACDSRNALPDVRTLLQDDLDSLIQQICHEIQPYTITRKLSLIKSNSKHPDIKTADTYAKDGLIRQSEELFYSVYLETGDFAAGYNAALLMQAEGRLKDSRQLLSILVADTGDTRAVKALDDVEYEILQEEKLNRQRKEAAGWNNL